MFEKKFYQMFILGTGQLDIALSKNIGGVIFFSRDIKSYEQFKTLIEHIKTKAKTPLFLSIDQEGGRVERTENLHPRVLSPLDAFGKGDEFLYNQNLKMLEELKEFGINMNFAPCLDVNSNPNNPIIAERAFSSETNDVCHGFDIVNNAYKRTGIIPVVKHFPGHGDANKDSHLELPLIDLSMEEMEKIHIKPFSYAIKQGGDAIMAAHLHCSCFDKEPIPTSLSVNCLNYLRNELNFNGVIISDDMFMNGVKAFGDTKACLKGIDAGLNMFIYRDSSISTLNTLEEVFNIVNKDTLLRSKVNESYDKIIALKSKYRIF